MANHEEQIVGAADGPTGAEATDAIAGDAVWFRFEDYAGVGRRVLAWWIDLIVVMLLFILICAPLVRQWHPPPTGLATEKDPQRKTAMQLAYQKTVLPALLIGNATIAAAYHLFLRRLRGGTPGYRVAGIRLVDTRGHPPRWGGLVKRFILAFVLTLPFWATYVACALTRRRQALHDVWCGTWLVRKRAEPAGPAVVKERAKFVGSWMFTFVDIAPVGDGRETEN